MEFVAESVSDACFLSPSAIWRDLAADTPRSCQHLQIPGERRISKSGLYAYTDSRHDQTLPTRHHESDEGRMPTSMVVYRCRFWSDI